MYEQFYGFREPPFELTPNPKFLVVTDSHREVLSNLQYGLSSCKGIMVVTGEAGTGKTTLVRTALGAEQQHGALDVYINNPTLTRPEFFEYLAQAFQLSRDAERSKAVFLLEFERLLLRRRETGSACALVIDEAQSMPLDLLEEIRLLANIETSTTKLLAVVLVGQPQLAERLNDPSLCQLKQRVVLRCDLRPLDLKGTATYIAARVRSAGGEPTRIFTRESVLVIHDRSRGIPRLINVICDNTLVSGFAMDRRPVGQDIVLEVCNDLDLRPDGTEQSARLRLVSESRSSAPAHAAGSATPAHDAGALSDERPMFSTPPARRRFSLFKRSGS